MSVIHVIAVIIRLFAFAILLLSLKNTLSMVSLWIDLNSFDNKLYVTLLVPVFLSVVLWVFSDKLARMITADLPQKLSLSINLSQLMRVVVISIGLVILCQAVIEFSHWFFNAVVFETMPDSGLMFDSESILNTVLVAAAVHFVLAILLLAKNHWIAKTLLRINTPEQDQVTDKASQED